MKKLIIIGGGFAGFWGAMSAVRQARELGAADRLAITLISRDRYHTNRTRLYEADLAPLRIDLDHYCKPLGIELAVGEVAAIDPAAQTVSMADNRTLPYDALLFAAGSHLRRDTGVSGIERSFDVDSFEGAQRLARHLEQLDRLDAPAEARHGAVVVGSGLTGIEVAVTIGERIASRLGKDSRVHLVDRGAVIPSGYGEKARQYIADRLDALNIERHQHSPVTAISRDGVTLASGRHLAAATVVWCGGLQASPLVNHLGQPDDALGRIAVDPFLRLPDHPEVFVAGDAAQAAVTDDKVALMSCQHAMPQGKLAGHNAAAHLLGAPMRAYEQPHYQNCLDLGRDDGIFTSGWEGVLEKSGRDASDLKRTIVTQWIVPPADADAAVEASAPA